jgi:hypothetical protein
VRPSPRVRDLAEDEPQRARLPQPALDVVVEGIERGVELSTLMTKSVSLEVTVLAGERAAKSITDVIEPRAVVVPFSSRKMLDPGTLANVFHGAADTDERKTARSADRIADKLVMLYQRRSLDSGSAIELGYDERSRSLVRTKGPER